jgi:DNA-binding response OmpR family regulator
MKHRGKSMANKPQGKAIKLMVVDDEAEVCDYVKGFFSERNFEVFTSYNGRDALACFDAQKPEIVLLDVKMPIMDGMQTLKEMRKRNQTSKIIMVTALDDIDKIKEARSCGAVDYITKPLSLEQLELAVLSAAGTAEGSGA